MFLLFGGLYAFGQRYYANGDAKYIGGDCYDLTPSAAWKLGSVWYDDQIDLSKDFDLEFYINLGSNDYGADGVVFVLQDVGNRAIGQAGGGLGFDGFSPSLGIEFDSYQNTSIGDPSYDHMAVFRDGTVDHNSSKAITGTVQMHKTKANVEDGENHLVRVKWIQRVKQLKVWFDCDLRISTTYDIQEKIFGGNSMVYWGFTAATGGLHNYQRVCLRKDILVQDTFPICKGDTAPLNVRNSKDGIYRWSPTSFLDDASIKRPNCSSKVPKRYFAQYTDLCGDKVVDTIEVVIHQPFQMDEGKDTLLCDGQALRFDFRAKYDSVLWEDNSQSLFRIVNNRGLIKLRAWQGVCYDDDSFNVTTDIRPKITLTGDSIFCANDSSVISLSVQPVDADFSWQDGSTSLKFSMRETGALEVIANNKCGEASKRMSLRKISFDDFRIIGDSLLCDNETTTLSVHTSQSNYDYYWSTGQTDRAIQVSNEGRYAVTVFDHHCYGREELLVKVSETPMLDFPSDIILCEREKLVLRGGPEVSPIVWNGVRGDSLVLFDFEGLLQVKSSNSCGADSTTIEVLLQECLCELILPNAITPNDDQLNEIFRPHVECNKLLSYELAVYNRWGQKVYQTNDIESINPPVSEVLREYGIFTWVMRYSGFENGQEVVKNQSGVVHVLE
jgi:hypothetical protein